MRMHDDQVDTDVEQLRRLLQTQQPQWAALPIERLPSPGTDNSIYRLGDDLVVRMPLIHWAVGQVDLEHTWLPRIAPNLPLRLHEPVALGEPGEGYPWRWSVYRWLNGERAHPSVLDDEIDTARDLAAFVRAFQSLDPTGMPRSGRGVPLAPMDDMIRGAIEQVRDETDADVLLAAWDDAIHAPKWSGPWLPVHGDLSDGNLLVRGGRLHAVIDFSCFGLSDPANDIDVAWDLFSPAGRDAYRAALDVDDATWARARGWAVRSVFGIPYYRDSNPGIVERARRRLANVIEEYQAR